MPEMESRDAGLLLTPKQANPRARPTAARRYFRTNGLFAPRVSTRGTPRQRNAPHCGGVRAGPPAPGPGRPRRGGVRSHVFSTERRRADIKGGHFIAHVRHGDGRLPTHVPPAPPPRSPPRWAATMRTICENMLLTMRSQLSFHVPQARLSTLTPPPFDPPQRGHPIPETFRDASRGSRCARSAPRRAAVSCVPCLSRVRALCGTAPTCCEHPASRVERGMAVTRHTLMDTLDKIPPSSLTDSTHTQLACRKGRVHSSPDLHA